VLEKPNLSDAAIADCLREAYGLNVGAITFLPLGADVNTAVYRADGDDGSAWFVKLRKGPFDEAWVAIPAFLQAQGVRTVMAALPAAVPTAQGRLWAPFEPYTLIVYPFVSGANAYEQSLSDAQWAAFGTAMAGIHTASLPGELAARLPREDFSPAGRDRVAWFQRLVENRTFAEPVSARLAAFMRAHRAEIDWLRHRSAALALELPEHHLPAVLCHSDLHPGNLLICPQGTPEPGFFIVDWDQPMWAPKERDLMGIGGGLGARWSSPHEVKLFYTGYTHGNDSGVEPSAGVDHSALTYYRCERVLADIAAFCEQLLLSEAGGEDREQSFGYFTSSFLPGHEIDAAHAHEELNRDLFSS
jgi:spectinomycin phosphotransferase